jgi:hypothetical protein
MRYFLSFMVLVIIRPLFAQHEHVHDMMDTTQTVMMSSAITPLAPMQRDGSGTSWLPDSSPMYAIHWQYRSWGIMMHGNFFLRYTDQNINNSKKRSGRQFSAPNWFMFMGQHTLSQNSRLMLRTMLSFDRLTEGGNGYPLLFQSGESWHGKKLVDRQHPHDLFSELAIAFSHKFENHSSLFAYFGLPGESALGPPAFMHRLSAMNNPDAPVGHHWQDATHITFGVATAGFQYKQLKFDGSIFTGREPDENRFNIDKARFNSYGFRISLNPSKFFALQASYAFLKSPERLEPRINVKRVTASMLYNHQFDDRKNWATTFIWGMNKPGNDNEEHSFLVESDLSIGKNSFYNRYEFVQKSSYDLNIIAIDEFNYNIHVLTLGAARNIIDIGNISLLLGFQGTVNRVGNVLQAYYGEHPLSFEIYLRLSPSALKMYHHHKMHHTEQMRM